jgi:hypothetical protein
MTSTCPTAGSADAGCPSRSPSCSARDSTKSPPRCQLTRPATEGPRPSRSYWARASTSAPGTGRRERRRALDEPGDRDDHKRERRYGGHRHGRGRQRDHPHHWRGAPKPRVGPLQAIDANSGGTSHASGSARALPAASAVPARDHLAPLGASGRQYLRRHGRNGRPTPYWAPNGGPRTWRASARRTVRDG